jgi:hypothetical protein
MRYSLALEYDILSHSPRDTCKRSGTQVHMDQVRMDQVQDRPGSDRPGSIPAELEVCTPDLSGKGVLLFEQGES